MRGENEGGTGPVAGEWMLIREVADYEAELSESEGSSRNGTSCQHPVSDLLTFATLLQAVVDYTVR